jgi:CRP/FNR family cyclic AMP-dependent transcriptional regulator
MEDPGANGALPDWSMTQMGLSAAEAQAIDSRFLLRSYAAGAVVFSQGEHGDDFFVIAKGRVRLFHTSASGKEYMSGIWSDGYPLGLVSAVLGERRIQSVQALGDLMLRSMRREELFVLMAALPRFSINLSRLLAAMAHFSILRSGPLVLESSAARLGRVLLRLATPEGNEGASRHVIRGIRQDELARMVGASRPWVTLTLASFERKGLVERRRGYLAIVDRPAFDRHLASLADN